MVVKIQGLVHTFIRSFVKILGIKESATIVHVHSTILLRQIDPREILIIGMKNILRREKNLESEVKMVLNIIKAIILIM